MNDGPVTLVTCRDDRQQEVIEALEEALEFARAHPVTNAAVVMTGGAHIFRDAVGDDVVTLVGSLEVLKGEALERHRETEGR